jgi:hypothetical protein
MKGNKKPSMGGGNKAMTFSLKKKPKKKTMKLVGKGGRTI